MAHLNSNDAVLTAENPVGEMLGKVMQTMLEKLI